MSKITLKLNFIEITNDLLQVNLENGLRNLTYSAYTKFQEDFLRTLDYHAPLKKKILRANVNSFMSKPLRKAIMLRSRENFT